jgi:hypothetical protein
MSHFTHPRGLCSFAYPEEWTATHPITDGAFFAAQAFAGEILFEAFALLGPNQAQTIPRVMKATIDSLKSDHPFLSIVLTDYPECDYNCELKRVAYSEQMGGRFSKVQTITDLYVLADGNHALALFFKVVKGRHPAMQAEFEQVMRSARLYASENW